MNYEKQISYIKIIADRKFDGHYLVMNIDGIYKGAFSLPTKGDFLKEVDRLCSFSSMEDLLNDMLQNETCFS